MNPGTIGGRLIKRLLGRHSAVKSFEHELQAGGGMAGRTDAGLRTVEVRKVVGSVGRAATLRSDFFYRRGRAMTARFHRVGQAMREGKALPPLELYKVTHERHGADAAPASEYYVVDGHHRVAMARKLGQDFFDAHVTAYRLAGTPVSPAEHVPAQAVDGQTAEPGRESVRD
jgi:hypothetical protein